MTKTWSVIDEKRCENTVRQNFRLMRSGDEYMQMGLAAEYGLTDPYDIAKTFATLPGGNDFGTMKTLDERLAFFEPVFKEEEAYYNALIQINKKLEESPNLAAEMIRDEIIKMAHAHDEQLTIADLTAILEGAHHQLMHPNESDTRLTDAIEHITNLPLLHEQHQRLKAKLVIFGFLCILFVAIAVTMASMGATLLMSTPLIVVSVGAIFSAVATLYTGKNTYDAAKNRSETRAQIIEALSRLKEPTSTQEEALSPESEGHTTDEDLEEDEGLTREKTLSSTSFFSTKSSEREDERFLTPPPSPMP